MVDWTGSKVGGVLSATQSVPLVSLGNKGGAQRILQRDTIELAAGFAQNDRVSLGKVASNAIIDPVASKVFFDDLGTGITMDIGSTAAENALAAAVDVATAAGSCLLYQSVDIAKYASPLWEVLGLSADPGGFIELFAKLEGGDPGTGTVSWQIIGWAQRG